jgi:hypothetical protein
MLRYYSAPNRQSCVVFDGGCMQFIGKLNEADLADVRKLRRTKLYWAWVLLANKYPIVFGMIMLYAIYSGFEGWSTPDWPLTAAFFAVVIGVAAFALFKKRQSARETPKNVNEKLPERIDLIPEGVKLDGINGRNRTVP